MKTRIYQTANNAFQGKPYIFTEDGKGTQLPTHPNGKTWQYWKTVTMGDSAIGVDPVKIKAGIEAEGFYLIN